MENKTNSVSPNSSWPSQARVVIIGGGVIGCNTAYHLAKLGWKDILLLERKQLTCGTTWHAAGLIVSGGFPYRSPRQDRRRQRRQYRK